MRRFSLTELEADFDHIMMLVEVGEAIVLTRDNADIVLIRPVALSEQENSCPAR